MSFLCFQQVSSADDKPGNAAENASVSPLLRRVLSGVGG
jgi:hypothetical protein